MSSICMYGIAVDGEYPYTHGKTFLKNLGWEDEFKDSKIVGCKHKYDRSENQFCSKCGAQAYIIQEAVGYGDLVGEITEDIVKKTGLDFEWIYDNGWVLGVEIKKTTELKDLIIKLNNAEQNLNKYFPNEKPTFFIGSGC